MDATLGNDGVIVARYLFTFIFFCFLPAAALHAEDATVTTLIPSYLEGIMAHLEQTGAVVLGGANNPRASFDQHVVDFLCQVVFTPPP